MFVLLSLFLLVPPSLVFFVVLALHLTAIVSPPLIIVLVGSVTVCFLFLLALLFLSVSVVAVVVLVVSVAFAVAVVVVVAVVAADVAPGVACVVAVFSLVVFSLLSVSLQLSINGVAVVVSIVAARRCGRHCCCCCC